jgi:hypothetical protein
VTARQRLRDRRASELFGFESQGMKFTASISRFPDGRIGELFLDNHYSGSATVNGREYWLSGWKKKSKSGTPFLSLSFKAKDGGSNKAKAKPEFDDDIEF